MLSQAEQIIAIFEEDDPTCYDKESFTANAEVVAMYLAALKYVERYG